MLWVNEVMHDAVGKKLSSMFQMNWSWKIAMVGKLNSPMAAITGEKEKKKRKRKLCELVDYELGNRTKYSSFTL